LQSFVHHAIIESRVACEEQKKVEVNKAVWDILRPRILQLLELCNYSEEIIECFAKILKTLVRRQNTKKITPNLVYERLIMLIEVLVRLDNLKDIKSSVLNDFAAYKRSMAIVRDTLDDEDYDQEVKKLQFFLAHPKSPKSAMFYELSNKVQRIMGYESVLKQLLRYVRESLGSDNDHTVTVDNIRYLLPCEKHRFLLVVPHIFLLIDQKNGSINAFHLEGLRKKPFAAMMKATPVLPLYRDMSIQPYYILRRCPNWDESDVDRWMARDEDQKKLPAAYDVVSQWQQIRTEHSEYMVEFTDMVNTVKLATKRANAVFGSVSKNLASAQTPRRTVKASDVGSTSYVEVLARGFKLLAKWKALILEHIAWKLFHHSDSVPPHEANRFKGLRGIEYAKAIRWNLSKVELPVIIDIVSMIKTLFGLMSGADAVLAPHIRSEIHQRLQIFVQRDLVPLLYKATKKKRPVRQSLIELRSMMADWAGGMIPSDMEKCARNPRPARIGSRAVGPSSTQLALFQMTLQLMFHENAEGMNRSWWSGKDFDDSQVKMLDKMYKECFYFPYILQYGDTLRQLGDLGDLLFREYMLEVTHCTQFPLAMSFPWILTEHLLESRADINTMDNLVHVLDIYNDAGHRALYNIKQQHLFNEIEAEVNLVFDQISVIVSNKVYQHFKDCAAFLELPPQYRQLLQSRKPRKFQLDQERFAVALKQKHIEILGRSVNLSKILCQYIGNYFQADMEYIVRKFEASGIETIIELEHYLRVMRRMHELLQKALDNQLDDFESIMRCTDESIAPTTFSGRICSHIQNELVEELFPWHIYNSGSRRFVRVPGAEAGDRGAMPRKAYNFLGWGVKCHGAYEKLMKVRRRFVGTPHIESIVRIVGCSELSTIASTVLDSIVETTIVYVCPALERVGPDLEAQKLPSATTAMASCTEALYMRVYHPLLKLKDNVELRPVVMHSMRQLGNALVFLRLLEDVVSVEESQAFLQVSTLLAMDKKHQPLRAAAEGLSKLAAENETKIRDDEARLLMSIADAAEKLYAPLCQKVQILPQALHLVKQVIEGGDFDSLRGNAPGKMAIDHISKESRVEFHRIWSCIYFMYCMHETGTDKDESKLGDAQFGDGFFWSACALLHILGQRRKFELMDLSYYLLTVRNIEEERYPPNPVRLKLIEGLKATGMGHELQGIPFYFKRVKSTKKLIDLIFAELENTAVESPNTNVTFEPPSTDAGAQSQGSRRNKVVVAKWAYDATRDGELSFEKGDRVTIIDDSGDWWTAVAKGERGLVPRTHFR